MIPSDFSRISSEFAKLSPMVQEVSRQVWRDGKQYQDLKKSESKSRGIATRNCQRLLDGIIQWWDVEGPDIKFAEPLTCDPQILWLWLLLLLLLLLGAAGAVVLVKDVYDSFRKWTGPLWMSFVTFCNHDWITNRFRLGSRSRTQSWCFVPLLYSAVGKVPSHLASSATSSVEQIETLSFEVKQWAKNNHKI